ncbi:MAG: hydrogenase maturation nickel metallochaperone HypA [Aminobacterium sp.]|jgi:hydrogenase nickel incorporation protein HypA/HybF|uniref:hydrogenase maturation nickel metallochaperone HypA n=1 Tax=unclassified Aminobacterium TaxID=2685012 RepID=UPI001BCCBCE3|nr:MULTISPECIES: hydrogenase maturation nickel metallochaperone HypA [unclassified Aminobacterium]MDD2205749.1 hydrogenase maturation nickel metallochaperone HypA [Aminobacterium sp.]MDD3427260.1 hydrogenase maturation nickel metallochaperone HypA [Aminobacterium sp.]MDD3707903.1 hydrogenase maturation nickel metallochaperone HypA [Aminobacterium sp.]MDD4229228.1 hydrogenase maturation nickel metallochaperone HypA [Aminobacterium sp.]MDD4551995.1 hydrogenase maturation nickel metallochaperone 
MHEMSLVESVIESLLQLKEQYGWERVEKVTLHVGAMRQVIPDVMIFAYQIATEHTPLEGSKMEIIEVPMHFRCKKCLKEWGEDQMDFVCPFCGGFDVDVLSGMELDIESVEVQECHGESV